MDEVDILQIKGGSLLQSHLMRFKRFQCSLGVDSIGRTKQESGLALVTPLRSQELGFAFRLGLGFERESQAVGPATINAPGRNLTSSVVPRINKRPFLGFRRRFFPLSTWH